MSDFTSEYVDSLAREIGRLGAELAEAHLVIEGVKRERDHLGRQLDYHIERSTQAAAQMWAEIDRLRAELAEAERNWALDTERWDADRTAIVRVRELCATLNRDYPRNECTHLFLAALDGAE